MEEAMTTEAPTYLDKIKGEKTSSGLAYPKPRDVLIGGAGGFLVISLLYLLHAEWQALLCFIVPFGASAVLVFAGPSAPFSQPRNVVGGHVIAALVGVTFATLLQADDWWVLASANGVAIMLMMLTKTVHPPAGATAFLPIIAETHSFLWILLPVLTGALIIVIVGVLYNNLWAKRRYPSFWW
jgi:CBS-domain-containing membrane protein